MHEWCSLFDVSNHLTLFVLFTVGILCTIWILINIFFTWSLSPKQLSVRVQSSVRVHNRIYLKSQIITHMLISKYINLQNLVMLYSTPIPLSSYASTCQFQLLPNQLQNRRPRWCPRRCPNQLQNQCPRPLQNKRSNQLPNQHPNWHLSGLMNRRLRRLLNLFASFKLPIIWILEK